MSKESMHPNRKERVEGWTLYLANSVIREGFTDLENIVQQIIAQAMRETREFDKAKDK